jgi:hypothetical protein
MYDDGRTRSALNRRGADFSILSGDLRSTYTLPGGISGSTSFSVTDADRGTPGAVTVADQTSGQRLADRVLRLHQSVGFGSRESGDGTVHFLFARTRQTYQDPGLVLDGESLNSRHDLQSLFLNPEIGREFSPGFAVRAGAELAQHSLSSTSVPDVLRRQQSLYVGTRHTLSRSGWPSEVIIYPSLRYDRFPGIAHDLSPKIGVSVALLAAPDMRFRATIGKSFRVPTFNELYWTPGGNPGLSPERSVSLDAGVAATAELGGVWIADLSAFAIRTRNKITWMPGTGGIWSPRNSGETTSRGVEAALTWTDPSGVVRLSVASTWTDARKQSEDYPGDPGRGKRLPYIPPQSTRLAATLRLAGVEAYLAHSMVSYRYTSEANDRLLPGYALTDVSFRYSLQLGGIRPFIRCAATNLFDTTYETFPQYPMPLRELTLTIGGDL